MSLKLSEKHYEATRGDCCDTYQTLSVTVEAEETGRNFLRFTLMEQRWRSKAEAAAYPRWAGDKITQLEV